MQPQERDHPVDRRRALGLEAAAGDLASGPARFGLAGGSADYISRHLKGGQPPKAISLDTIAKVSGRIERMARETLPRRQSRLLHPSKP